MSLEVFVGDRRVDGIFEFTEHITFGRKIVERARVAQRKMLGGTSLVDLDSIMVSRRHMAIRRGESGAWEVLDLGSKHGTTVDGSQLEPYVPVPLVNETTEIIAAGILVRVRIFGEQAQPETQEGPMSAASSFEEVLSAAAEAAGVAFNASTMDDGVDVYDNPRHFVRQEIHGAIQRLLALAGGDLEQAIRLIPEDDWGTAAQAYGEAYHSFPQNRESQLYAILEELIDTRLEELEPNMHATVNRRGSELEAAAR